jgi:hypothetical protein
MDSAGQKIVALPTPIGEGLITASQASLPATASYREDQQ